MKIPIRKIVFYKHGVGFIERSGKIDENEFNLEFKTENMNDILKSLTVIDKDGKVLSVSYDSHEGVGERLKNALMIPKEEAVSGLLKALIGNEVTISAEKNYTGKIVGIEIDRKNSNMNGLNLNLSSEKSNAKISLLDSKGTVHIVFIEKIHDIAPKDEKVLDDLRYFLDLSAWERKNTTKNVRAIFDGKGHNISISYIMSMPIWRVSYRFVHDEKTSLLQGWGIVDNPLDEELEDVQVSLIAGQPVSFIYDFYDPPLAYRPYVQEQARVSSNAIELEGQLNRNKNDGYLMERERSDKKSQEQNVGALSMTMKEMNAPKAMPVLKVAPGASQKPEEMKIEKGYFEASISNESIAQSTQVTATSAQMGAFFRYDVLSPTTMKRGGSAMLPILQKKIECKKTYVYNKQKNDRNPIVSLRFKNETGLTLERGPLTVYDEGFYAGEAILPFTKEGAEQFIAFAIELGVEVSSIQSSFSEMSAINLADEYVEVVSYNKLVTKYTLNNRTKKKMPILLEHPKLNGYELVDTKKPDEETENYQRWNMDIDAQKTIDMQITQGITTSNWVHSESLNAYTIRETYLKFGKINKEAKDILTKIAGLCDKKDAMADERQKLEEERQRYLDEQERLRENIKSLGSASAEGKLKNKYVEQMEKQEDRIQEILDRLGQIDKEEQTIQKQIKELLKAGAKKK